MCKKKQPKKKRMAERQTKRNKPVLSFIDLSIQIAKPIPNKRENKG
jgi:hypothetical protein